jgi:hypothetical protein
MCAAKPSAFATYCSTICPAHDGAVPENAAGHGVGVACAAAVGRLVAGALGVDALGVGTLTGMTAPSQMPASAGSAVVPGGHTAATGAASGGKTQFRPGGHVAGLAAAIVAAGAGVANAAGVALLGASAHGIAMSRTSRT